jgi:hypothetical protein
VAGAGHDGVAAPGPGDAGDRDRACRGGDDAGFWRGLRALMAREMRSPVSRKRRWNSSPQGHALWARQRAASASSKHGYGSPARGAGERAGGPPPKRGWKGHSPLLGGSLVRCLLRGGALARAAAATRSAPHPPAGGPHRNAPLVRRTARASRAVLPCRVILSPRKLPVKGAPTARPSASLRADP